MNKLQCDICGGSLIMQAGGKVTVCDSCGMRYSVERVREKVQEITGTVRIEGPVQASQTGTGDDVVQWRQLVDKYYKAGDYKAAVDIVKKILEAVPDDPDANRQYDELQIWNLMDIDGGILYRYHGTAKEITIPPCVREIRWSAYSFEKFLTTVVIPENVEIIGDRSFSGCKALRTVNISPGVKFIEHSAFAGCTSLTTINIPNTVKRIGEKAFWGCTSLTTINISLTVEEIGEHAFRKCTNLREISIPDRFITDSVFGATSWDDGSDVAPWYVERHRERFQAQQWKHMKLCRHCGGDFNDGFGGIFTPKCKRCGRKRDY